MLIYWEQSVGGVQEANFDTQEDDEVCEIQKPQMKNDEDKEQIIDPIMNTIFIFDLQISNNYSSARFGMQRSKDDMSSISVELAKESVQSPVVFSQSRDKWAQLTKGVKGERSGINTNNVGRLWMWSNWKVNSIMFIHNDDAKCFCVVI